MGVKIQQFLSQSHVESSSGSSIGESLNSFLSLQANNRWRLLIVNEILYLQ